MVEKLVFHSEQTFNNSCKLTNLDKGQNIQPINDTKKPNFHNQNGSSQKKKCVLYRNYNIAFIIFNWYTFYPKKEMIFISYIKQKINKH